MTALDTRCCIAGGGPAGMMLGFLLARAGIDVMVLEKHADFLRDFRGDTIHPSTLEVMHELGLLDEFLKLPHQKAHTLGGAFGREQFTFADFTHLPTRCKFIALMPQWDFLNFLADHGRRYPDFQLRMQRGSDRPHRGGRPRRRRARNARRTATLEIRADLVVARRRTPFDAARTRRPAGAKTSARRWTCSGSACRTAPSDPDQSMGRFEAGRIFVLIDRGDYWQCAYVIPKGTIEDVRRARARGVPRRVRAKRADVRGPRRRT